MPNARILFDSRWIAAHGIGRVASEMLLRLRQSGFDVVELNAKFSPSSPLDCAVTLSTFLRTRADLFVTCGYNGNPLLGSRQVFYIHDLIHLSASEPTPDLKRYYYDHIIRFAARSASAVITVSEATKSRLAVRWPEIEHKTLVAPNGLSPEFSGGNQRTSMTRRGIVLFFNTRWHKNLFGMVEGIKLANVDSDPVLFVGRPPVETQRISIEEKIAPRSVSWLGELSDAALASTLQSARILLYCSYEEGFGLPLIEGLASGIEVVASDLDVFREVGGEHFWHVDPRSPVKIAGAIDEINLGKHRNRSGYISDYFQWDKSYAVLHKAIMSVVGPQ